MNSILIFISLCFICSCTSKKAVSGEQAVANPIKDDSLELTSYVEQVSNEIKTPSFHVVGTEPFWNMSIKQDSCLFTFMTENIDSVYFTLDSFSVSNAIAVFYLKDNHDLLAKLNLLKTGKCSDGMSDKIYPYEASFYYKRMTLNGCAEKQ